MNKNALILMLILSISSWMISAQAFDVTESGGWFESAYVKWTSNTNADSYNVYYSGEGLTDVKIDDSLIRQYPEYFRADLVGLKAGNYTIKIKPVIEGVEGSAISTSSIDVKAHDRSGFAFSNGRVPGAYKADGTLKDNAVVLYVTENTKNTIELSVTNANNNPCVGLQEILDGFKKGKDNRPLVVRIVGNVSDLSNMQGGDIVVENKNNELSYITVEGIGDDAVANGWGIRIKNASNIEIRNLGFMNCDSNEGDNVGLQQGNDYIWVHHCDMFYGHAGGDSDQQKGDGALDTKDSNYVTMSYNHFWDTGKSNLVGLKEKINSYASDALYITFHHNWYDHSDSRHPRIRYYNAHVYNNYYDGTAKYGAGSTLASSVFMQNNYFRNANRPMMISMQGTDVYSTGTKRDPGNLRTFSGEDGGIIKAHGNVMTGKNTFIPYGATDILTSGNWAAASVRGINTTEDFDAYVVANASDQVPNTVKSYQGNNHYSNFDTNGTSQAMYSWTAESAEDAVNTVIAYAGRLNGGDFQWTFNNSVDDNSYAVNSALKQALTSYTTKLVAIQGETSSGNDGDDGGDDGDNSGGSQEPNVGDETHNFTLAGTNSTFYTIVGNLSTGKGTVEYAGLTLTQCLKIESSTSIKFNMDRDGQLILVFENGFNGKVKINDVNYEAINGILEVDLDADAYEITKNASTNLFYMTIVWNKMTNIDNIVSQTNISIYPNPAVDRLNISSNTTIAKVEIFNLSGVNVMSVRDNLQSVDVSNLNRGSYVAIVTTNDGTIFKQIILKK